MQGQHAAFDLNSTLFSTANKAMDKKSNKNSNENAKHAIGGKISALNSTKKIS